MNKQSNQIFETYNDQYNVEDNIWRDLGGKQKSKNIIELCKNKEFNNVLDVGSGDGAVLTYLDKNNFNKNIFSLEISDSGIKKIKNKNLKTLKEVVKFDGYNIPFEDKKFDLSTCSHVIEHVEHPRLLLREIARVSKNQFFEIPIDFSFFVDKKLNHYLKYGHINIFTPSLFKFLLKSEGFEIIEEKFIFTSNELINFQFKNNLKRLIIQKIKNLLVSLTSLKKIKPSAYAVLCRHNGKPLQIF